MKYIIKEQFIINNQNLEKMELHGPYYLNNSGSRWVVFEHGKKIKVTFQTVSGKIIERTPIYFESFGNFGCMLISYKGKKIKVLADTKLED